MTLKLVPDEEKELTEEEARAYLTKLSTPILNAFRVKVKTLKTSELIGLAVHAERAMPGYLGLTDMRDATSQETFMAAMLALSDEIDRRVPVPA